MKEESIQTKQYEDEQEKKLEENKKLAIYCDDLIKFIK